MPFKKTLLLATLTLFLIAHSIHAFSAENLDEFWLGKLPEVIEKIPDIEAASINIHTWGESALYSFKNELEHFKVICHFHPSNSYHHCSKEEVYYYPPENASNILDMPSQSLAQIIESMGLSQVSTNESVWPWIVGALAGYYVSKKLINYWVNKNFESAPHSHEFSLLEGPELESAINDQFESVEAHTKGLNEIFSTDVKLNFIEKEKVRLLLVSRIKDLNKRIIDDLLGSYCSTCNTIHTPHQSHSPSNFTISSFPNPVEPNTSFSTNPFLQTENTLNEDTKDNQNQPRYLVQKSAVLKTAKALITDIHKEFIKPIPKMLSFARRLVSRRENFRQINSYAQTKYNTSIGESNIATGVAIASSLISIKVLGETLESMVVGPYHVFCQISDVAALTTGLVFLTTYHSLRQPLKLRKPRLLVNRRFWSLMFEKLKNPTLNGRLTAAQKNENFSPSESLILELEKLKNEIQKWIWQLRSNKSLTSSQAKTLARKLGAINKEKEDVIFKTKISDDYSSKELLILIESLKPIYQSYSNLFQEISNEHEKTIGRHTVASGTQSAPSCTSLL